MSKINLIFLTVSAVCTCAVLVQTAPSRGPRDLTIELSEVLDKSVCPMEQVIDDDPMRIPRRIKMLKCGKRPNPVCAKENVTAACCGHRHHNFSTECVEVIDQVLVKFLNTDELTTIPVSVGCTCMIREATPAVEET